MAATLPLSLTPVPIAPSKYTAADTGRRKQSDPTHNFTSRIGEIGRLSTSDAAGRPVDALGLRRRSSERIPIRGRQSSLRRVKNSTDMLRERSLKRQKSSSGLPVDANSGGREGRQFTVANVGNNGMIYLRPVKRPQQLPQIPSANFGLTSPGSTANDDRDKRAARDSVWTFLSSPAQPLTPQPTRSPFDRSASRSVSRSKRSMSASTAEDPGAFKIVIDRAESMSNGLDGNAASLPTLEVPIPHYRLGEPRFSTQGTAFLHHSAYTGSSHEDVSSSVFSGGEYERLFPKPPGMEGRTVLSRRHSHASTQPYSMYGNSAQARSARSPGPQPPLSHPRGVIHPQIYDAIAANPNDPAVVRYAVSGEIAAATPARIIAQITSESFLDYELLSDFFLTVRAYLSTMDLLAYLLARFEWAINRFDDNGRVIRVRAFAALRHLILNYFSYDFVIDRDLRVQFCDRLNNLTQVVKARADYGASDMKLISDLKKCWNGRCLLYWDAPPSTANSLSEVDIRPGGILGSRDSQLVHPSQLQQNIAPLELPQNEPNPQVASGSAIDDWYKSVTEHGEREKQTRGHERTASGATVRSLPISPISEQSVPAMSCSIPIPAKGFRKVTPYTNKALGIHPIPLQQDGKRVCPAAPSSSANEEQPRPATGHRRSGSFSDAARDRRAPLSSEIPSNSASDVHVVQAFGGSLIRGNVVSPGQPFVNFFAPTTPALDVSRIARDNEGYGDRKLAAPNNPGMKSLLGSIRRALSSKQSVGHQSNLGGNGGSAPSLFVGRSGSTPMNVIYQAASSGQLQSFRSVRIDLLSVEIADVYREATVGRSSRESLGLSDVGMTPRAQNGPFVGHTLTDHQAPEPGLQPPNMRRMDSGVTDGSQSILIMDDTGLDIPELPKMYQNSTSEAEAKKKIEEINPPSPDPALINVPLTADLLAQQTATIALVAPEQPASLVIPPSDLHLSTSTAKRESRSQSSRPPMAGRGHSHKATKSSSISLRKYASFQSTFAKHSHDRSIDEGTMDMIFSERTSTSEPFGKFPTHVLRRRPGGDLRANQNVHDLEELTRPRSTGSITTYTESLRSSQLLSFGDKINRNVASRSSSRPPQVALPEGSDVVSQALPSMVRTHSSQPELRRPSFEAAVAEFARIPDDDEGGIEATLLKLEGKYQKSPIQSPVMQTFAEAALSPIQSSEEVNSTENKLQHRHEHFDEDVSILPYPLLEGSNHYESTHSFERPQQRTNIEPRETITSVLYADSEESYNSTPLLERGAEELLQNDRRRSPAGRQHLMSVEYDRDDELRMLRRGSPAPTATTDSFLLDEDDDFLSDLSSEMSMQMVDRPAADHSYPGHGTQQHENTVLVGHNHPPSPPMTMENALSISSQSNHAHEQRKPPTPDPSPISKHVLPNAGFGEGSKQAAPGAGLKGPRHMPFILGYDSELLAQQFTIVERDALNEIDWRDLVDMRWQNAALSVTNWVDYLSTQDAQGIDLVTARFNLMVKWAVSEIVLTASIDERALSIVKYIHIAQQARKIHNYATLLQLTIALTSVDCSRLTKTWELVPAADKKTLRELEALVSPRRNFHNLRTEMEKSNSDEGCIPVVALYIHDLTYNSQKPAEVSSMRGGEPLVNFERYRCTALIVKNLLRLIDASSKYTYQAVDGAIDRCVWMASLPDEAITLRSKQLEAAHA